MTDLIHDEATDGYPTDYLIARIKGRRTSLISDWRPVIEKRVAPDASDERIWEALLRELEWLHAQMNREMRATLAPLFALLEVKTIVLCLRNRAIGRTNEAARLLERSLLSDRVKETLLHGRDLRSTIAALGIDYEGNLADVENDLMRIVLQKIAAARLAPALRAFFVLFIDLRNVMLLYKRLRWSLGDHVRFISGGGMEVPELENIRDDAALDDLLKRVTGLESVSVAASEGALETVLLRSMTQRLERSQRSADDTALIIAYVWRLYVQARNLSILHHGAGLEPRVLERELIL